MPTVDLYGRNPNVEMAAFHYPYPLVADTEIDPKSHRWFTLPSTSTPVFGSSRGELASIEDTSVVLDPGNPRYNRQYGLGWLPSGSLDASASDESASQPWLLERVEKAREAMGPMKGGATEKIDKGITTFGDFWNRQSGPSQAVLVVMGALIAWNLAKSAGR